MLRQIAAEFGLNYKALAKIWMTAPADEKRWDEFENQIQIFAGQQGSDS
jgi:hypothetical protein